MKQTNDSWFDQRLSAGWSVVPVRAAFSEKVEKSGQVHDNYLSLTASAGVIPYAEKGDVGNKAPEDMSKCKKVEPGNFVLNSMNFGIGSFGVSAYEGVCSSVYLVLEPKTDIFNAEYLKRIFELPDFQQRAQSLGNGILAHRASFGWDKLRTMRIPMPPRAEQDAIVDYLDRALFELDELIEKLQLLRDLGKERMVAAISKLTRSEMSESNDLGWQYRKIGHLFRIVGSGTTPKADDESYFGGNTPWVTTGELRENVIYETERNVSDKALSEYSALRIFPKGSLVMALYGATIGRIAFLGIDSTVNQACCVMSDPLNVDSRFIYYALQGSKSRLLASAVGGGSRISVKKLLDNFAYGCLH